VNAVGNCLGGERRCNGREATATLSNQVAAATAPQNLRVTPAFAKSYGAASSRLYTFGVKRWWPVVIIVFVLFGAGAAVYVDWTWKRKLSPRGGRPFLTRVELPVPSFQQGDDKWRDDPLGGVPENGTLGGEGCAVAAAAMVFKFYGIDVDPQQLNWFLTATGGYTDQGWLYWDRAAWFAPDRVRHVYEDLPSYQLIDSNIAHGNPVIVRVRLASGITHFVVIAGKDGFDYLVRDPGAGSAKGFYPLRELGSDIEALRFYQPTSNPNPRVSSNGS
jgi:Peptidase_C39 like family